MNWPRVVALARQIGTFLLIVGGTLVILFAIYACLGLFRVFEDW